MRFPRILARYAVREALLYALLGLIAVSAILVTQNLLSQLDDVMAVGFGIRDGLALLGCVTAILSTYILPIAFLFGVIAAVSRLSSDAEVTAMRALGVSLTQLVLPFLALGVVLGGLTAALLSEVEPRARRQLRAVAADVAARGGLIQPGRFRRLDREKARLLLVDERDAENHLQGIFLSDRTDPENPFVVLARQGHFEFDRAKALGRIVLEDGEIHFGSGPEAAAHDTYRRIGFGRFDYSWDISALLGATLEQVRARELRTGEIREVLAHFDATGEAPPWARMRRRVQYEIQLHRRLALPFAPLLFAMLGVPLGLRRGRGASSWGALVCMALVFAYYVLLSFATWLAEEGEWPAGLTLWLPNAVFAATGLLLLMRARRAEI